MERRFLLRDHADLRMAFRNLRSDKDHSGYVPDLASTVIGMGLLLVLRPPQTRPKSLRRATRAQRREHRRADAEEWEIAQQRGWLLDVEVEKLLPLVNSAGAAGYRFSGSSTRGRILFSIAATYPRLRLMSTVWRQLPAMTYSASWWRPCGSC